MCLNVISIPSSNTYWLFLSPLIITNRPSAFRTNRSHPPVRSAFLCFPLSLLYCHCSSLVDEGVLPSRIPIVISSPEIEPLLLHTQLPFRADSQKKTRSFFYCPRVNECLSHVMSLVGCLSVCFPCLLLRKYLFSAIPSPPLPLSSTFVFILLSRLYTKGTSIQMSARPNVAEIRITCRQKKGRKGVAYQMRNHHVPPWRPSIHESRHRRRIQLLWHRLQ